MPRMQADSMHARETKEASAATRLAILRRIERLVDSANPVAIEHLATAYALVIGAAAPGGGGAVVDLRALGLAEPGVHQL